MIDVALGLVPLWENALGKYSVTMYKQLQEKNFAHYMN